MRKRAAVLLVLVSLLLLTGGDVLACWAGMTPEELFDRSELVVAGKILGPVASFKKEGFWMTKWQVRVDYIFTGESSSRELLVATPGAKHKRVFTSIDYDLNSWGDYVLLFLRKNGHYFEPLTPQGVVPLLATGTGTAAISNSEEFLQVYQLDANKVSREEMVEITGFLKAQELSFPQEDPAAATEKEMSFRQRFAAFLAQVWMRFLNLFTNT